MSKPPLFTIGFTQTTAQDFFERLRKAGVKRVIDVRLHNDSQLAGFAKKRDLPFFLHAICGIDYRHEPLLAPTEELMKLGRAKKRELWARGFRAEMVKRKIETKLDRKELEAACLLCAEKNPHDCHRSFVADYLQEKWGAPFRIEHL